MQSIVYRVHRILYHRGKGWYVHFAVLKGIVVWRTYIML